MRFSSTRPVGRSRKRLVLLNTAVEFPRFADYLHGLKYPVRIGFEATGNYHRPPAHFLKTEGFELELIPSLAVARTWEARHNSWDKNDPNDAQVLLHLLRTGFTQHYHDPLVNQIHDFQELSLTYAQISHEKTRMQHGLLTHNLPLYFPEIERYYHASRSQWLLELLRTFPTPALKLRLLEDIYRTAQSSIGLPVEQDSEAVAMFRTVLDEMSISVSFVSISNNARLCCAFWMAAAIAVRQTENSFRDKFERYLQRDPTSVDRKRMAYVAVAAKMARIILWDHQVRNRLPLLP